MLETLNATTQTVVLERSDWELITREEAARMIGVKRTTFYAMIEKGLISPGTRVFERDRKWTVGEMKGVAMKMHRGEFSGVKLWK